MGVSLRYGPDGGLFLTDWYDSQTCHNVTEEIWNRSNGRIYKINYGKSAATPVDLRKSSDLELVALQLHKNDWQVRTARRLLQERALAGKLDIVAVSAALKEILLKNADETRQLRALWASHAIGILEEPDLLEISQQKSEYLRAWSIQLMTENQNATPAMVKRFSELAANDSSAIVRLYLAAALQRIPLNQRWEIGAALLSHEEDSADHNLPLMAWYGVSDLVALDPNRALALAKNARIKTVRQYLIRRISENESGRDAVLAMIVGAGDNPWNADVLAGIAMAVAKEKSLPQPPNWANASAAFATLDDPDQRRNFEMVATVFGDKRMVAKFQQTLTDLSGKPEDRTAALDNLIRMQPADLGQFLIQRSSQSGDPMRADWIRSLALVKDPAVVPFLVETFPNLNTREKESAVQALAGSEDGARKLAEGLASGSVKREEISAFLARQMRAYDNPEITTAVEKYWGRISAGQAADKLKEIDKLAKALSPKVLAKADLRKGRELFQATCFACHQLFGEGMKLGPDLTGSNRGEVKYLLENIIDPSSLVGLDYQLHSVEKTDGQWITGLLRDKTPTALTIGMLGGSSVIIPIGEIKAHQVAETSMMPEGLLANLTDEQVRDLIGYLQSPKQVPLPIAGEITVGDDRIKVAEVNRGAVQQQSMGNFKADSWSEGTQLWWTEGQPGDRVVLQFENAKEARYEVHAVFTKAHDYGKFRVKINGAIGIESIDLFHQSGVITTGEVSLGTHLIKAGLNQLTLEMLEPNPAATPKNMLGLDHLRLIPAK